MHILIVGLNFHPEPTGIGKYTGEMAAYLSREGHQVRVITTPPYYPYWKVQADYRWWGYRHETRKGMNIYRCPLWVPRKPTGAKRLVHLLSFALSSFPVVLGQIFWRPNLVICIAPAFFSAPFAWIMARLSNAKVWLHIQDFELDAAANLGLLPAGHFLTRSAARIESWLLRRFDKVSTISDRMLSRLRQKGVSPERACLFPNWVDSYSIFPLTEPRASLRRMFDLPEDKIIVLYSGSMGNKQGLEIVPDVARELQTRADVFFVFCGEGPAREGLENAVKGLLNIRFLPLQPPEKLNRLLNTADIHILPQKAGAADLVMPSRLLGMLASGKATIATANPDTEIGCVVGQVGIIVPPGERAALCNAIITLADSPQMRSRLGEKGRAFVIKSWTAERLLGIFQSQIQSLVKGSIH